MGSLTINELLTLSFKTIKNAILFIQKYCKTQTIKIIAQADKMSTWAIIEKRTLLFNQS